MASRTWQLQEAKNRLSQVVDRALQEGPQVITRHGAEVVIVIAYEQYQSMLASRQKLSEFFQESPLAEVELELERDKSPLREPLSL